jgi:hypothetical protein
VKNENLSSRSVAEPEVTTAAVAAQHTVPGLGLADAENTASSLYGHGEVRRNCKITKCQTRLLASVVSCLLLAESERANDDATEAPSLLVGRRARAS